MRGGRGLEGHSNDFKKIIKQVAIPKSVQESLASSAVRVAHQVSAELIIVLSTTGFCKLAKCSSVYLRALF